MNSREGHALFGRETWSHEMHKFAGYAQDDFVEKGFGKFYW